MESLEMHGGSRGMWWVPLKDSRSNSFGKALISADLTIFSPFQDML